MKFTFKDIDNPKIYEDSQVVFVTGQYPIFINLVVDMLKETCRIDDLQEDIGLLDEFGLSETESIASNSVDFETFLEVSKMPNINGRWICSTDLNILTKKQRESLNNYIKNPSRHGLLIVTSTEFREYLPYLKDRTVLGSQSVHIIQLSFPYRKKLITIVKELFEQRAITPNEKAIELFILRMSSSYNDYINVIESNIVQKLGIDVQRSIETKDYVYLDYKTMADCLKGVENFILDDFLLQLTVPIEKDKIVKTRRIYKMESAMLNEYGAKQLIFKLRKKLDEVIDMRVAINKGFVPIGIRYSVEESQKRIQDHLGEEHRLLKISEYPFRRLAELASQTSLKDWVSMRLILLSVKGSATESECERVIHTLVNRSIFSDDRMLNIVNVSNILESELNEINNKLYIDGLYETIRQENKQKPVSTANTKQIYTQEPIQESVYPVQSQNKATPQTDSDEALKYLQRLLKYPNKYVRT